MVWVIGHTLFYEPKIVSRKAVLNSKFHTCVPLTGNVLISSDDKMDFPQEMGFCLHL